MDKDLNYNDDDKIDDDEEWDEEGAGNILNDNKIDEDENDEDENDEDVLSKNDTMIIEEPVNDEHDNNKVEDKKIIKTVKSDYRFNNYTKEKKHRKRERTLTKWKRFKHTVKNNITLQKDSGAFMFMFSINQILTYMFNFATIAAIGWCIFLGIVFLYNEKYIMVAACCVLIVTIAYINKQIQ